MYRLKHLSSGESYINTEEYTYYFTPEFLKPTEQTYFNKQFTVTKDSREVIGDTSYLVAGHTWMKAETFHSKADVEAAIFNGLEEAVKAVQDIDKSILKAG
jgi:hypothetical protein